jgi:tetratricopeptide (TPR) repeat protein
LLWAARDYNRAGEYRRAALTVARTLDDESLLARSLNRVGNWHVNREQPQEGIPCHHEALAIVERLGDRRGIAETVDLIAMAHHCAGDQRHAASFYERSLALFDEAQDRRGFANALALLALCSPSYQSSSTTPYMSPVVAEELRTLRAARTAHDIGWRAGEAFARFLSADCLAWRGEYDRAIPLAREALALAQEIDHLEWTAGTLRLLGAMWLDLLAVDTAREQLEEAHAIVINKLDVITPEQLASLRAALEERYGVPIFTVSARSGEGLDEWFEWVTTNEQPASNPMELDYNLYAEGESLLSWLNASARVTAQRPFDGRQLLMYIASEIHTRLVSMGYEVAHLKMSLSDAAHEQEMAVLNLVRNDFQPEIVLSNLQPLTGGSLTINIRAEAPPEWLKVVTLDAIERRTQTYESLSIEVEKLVNFRPPRPQPTHRTPNYTSAEAG